MVKLEYKIIWKTHVIDEDLDSIGVIKTKDGNKVLVTAKQSGVIYEFNYETGEQSGKINYKFNRPNGIACWSNYVFVIDRDDHKMILYDYYNKTKILEWGENILKKPYGIAIGFVNNELNVFITDDGKDKIVYRVWISLKNGSINSISNYVKMMEFGFGSKLESIYLDENKKKLLIADEGKYLVYVYDFDTNRFINLFGYMVFNNEPEGISKFKNYWICTNQSKTLNRFIFINDETFNEEFEIKDNINTTNTDGICVFENKLFAINNDCQVVCYEIDIK